MKKGKLTLVKILQSQGFGSRKECTWLIKNAGVTIEGIECTDPNDCFETEGLTFEVASQPWNFRQNLYLLMNKPLGYECSHAPQVHESVFSLLPIQFVNRKVQIAGRLDVDTDGLLLYSDDGQFIHHVSSPGRGVMKTYRVTLKHPFDAAQEEKLREGVELHQEKRLVKAVTLAVHGEREVELTIDRGCYHQVRRMFGAVSNRVEKLRREAVGELSLEGRDLAPGEWCHLTPDELAGVKYNAAVV